MKLLPLAALALTGPLLAQSSTWTRVGPTGAFTFRTSPDYAVDGRVWIATGPESFAGDGQIHLSTDHGASFALQSTLPGAAPLTQALAVSPTYAQDSTLLATSYQNLVPYSTLWKSTDGGATWNATTQPSQLNWGNRFKTVVLAPEYASMPSILASCLGVGCHAQVSHDGGSTWTLNPLGQLKDLEFAPDFATSGIAYGVRSAGTHAFFRSDDFGMSFQQCSHPLGNTVPCAYLDRCSGITVAPVGPLGERTIFYFGEPGQFTSENFLRSVDDGYGWYPAGAGLAGLSVYDVVLATDYLTSGRLYAATSDGVWVSHDQGTSFTQFPSAGLPSPVMRLELAGGVDGDLYALAGGTPDPQLFGVGGSGIAYAHDVYRMRLAGTGVVDLGNGLAGAAGTPSLAATTDFGSSAVSLAIAQAPPSAPTIHVFGFAGQFLPLLGGVLVPTPDVEVRFPTSPAGTAGLTIPWPTLVPPGFEVFTQAWILDATAPQNFAASNGLKLTRL